MTTPRVLRAARTAVCCAALTLLPSPLSAQALRATDRERGRVMLREVRSQVEERFYDRTFNGVDLEARAAHADSIIRNAGTLGEVFGAIAGLTMELEDSHTYFIPPMQTVESAYGWDLMMVGDSAYVSRVDRGSDAERQGVRPGDRVLQVNGYTPARGNVWTMWYVFRLLRPQPGLRVVMRAPGGQARQVDLAARVRQRFRIVDLTGAGGGQDIYSLIRESQNEEEAMRPRFVEVGGDVLVWKLPTFDIAERTLRDALRRARGKRALVLDLRDNGGGPVAVLQSLVGGLNPNDVPIATQRERHAERGLVAPGTGADAFSGELVVLVDSRSASASELLARVAQLTRRGVVVGDRTAGAVSRGWFQGFAIGVERVVPYAVSVTDADLVMMDGGRLEGRGVIPDLVVLPTAAQLAAGEDPVLAEALAILGHPTDPAAAGALLRRR